MKIEIKEKELMEKRYPYLGIRPRISELGTIVLFTERNTGTCLRVSCTTGRVNLGECCNTWVEDEFHLFNGTITLSNQ